jgi:hypothetical protein
VELGRFEPSGDRSLEHLRARLDLLMLRVESAVARRREADPEPDDRFRGLYVADQMVDELLRGRRPTLAAPPPADGVSAAIEAAADEWGATGDVLRLRALAAEFGLDIVDVDILLTAMAPDLDQRFERLYGYLHDDVTRRRASVGLALELCNLDVASGDARRRLSASAPLVGGGLVLIEEPERPVLTRALRVPDRVSAHLLGDNSLDPGVSALLVDVPDAGFHSWPPLETAIASGMSPIYIRESRGTSAAWTCAQATRNVDRQALIVDLTHVATGPEPAQVLADVQREARVRGRILVATNVDSVVERGSDLVRRLADGGGMVILAGSRAWDPAWSRAVPLLLDVPSGRDPTVAAAWLAATDGGVSLDNATLAFRMTAIQTARAAEAGRRIARAHGRPVEAADFQAGARAQNAAGLDRLAHRIEPSASWSDLVLPGETATQLQELAARARRRELVYDEWRLGGRAARGRGITALLAGDSGTGKTLASEVVAGDLGLDLYVIDLSTVIDKYIGETEKNLDRIFLEADRVNGVLLFDEADAIFGKRSEVRDARDRYANVEVAYLLQRMERFDGLAILTTNLRANLDDAFIRRIDVIVDFPMPEEEDRRALWRIHLPPELPQSADIDLDFMARRFRMSGGNIRNVCVTAAFLAADADRAVEMADLIRGTEREYRKLGRLTVEDEFGPYARQAAKA